MLSCTWQPCSPPCTQCFVRQARLLSCIKSVDCCLWGSAANEEAKETLRGVHEGHQGPWQAGGGPTQPPREPSLALPRSSDGAQVRISSGGPREDRTQG